LLLPKNLPVILNPVAGRNRGSSFAEILERELVTRGFEPTVHRTTSSGHAVELARCLAGTGLEGIVIAGGDGTLNEVVNGLGQTDVVMGLISLGTGNDFARSLGLPVNDVSGAVRVLESGRVALVDLGQDEKGQFFVSSLGLGFPAVVAAETNRMRWLGGSFAYFAAVYRALGRMKPVPVEIELDDQTLKLECTSIIIQNTPFTGGGLKTVPTAEVNDGLLDVVVVSGVGKIDFMLNFPRVYRGSHLEHPSFSLYRSRCVEVHADSLLAKMCDGEEVEPSLGKIKNVPGALRVIVPRDEAVIQR